MADEPRFAKGDLNGVMAAYPHVAEWVRDFEMQYGSRPIYYGHSTATPRNNARLTSFMSPANPFLSTSMNHRPTTAVAPSFVGLEPQLTKKRRTSVVNLLNACCRKPHRTVVHHGQRI